MKARRASLVTALVLVLAASLLAAGSGYAQTTSPDVPAGTQFTYQGQLRQSGRPVNGLCDFRASVWPAASAGSKDLEVLIPDVQVREGYFTMLLPLGTPPQLGREARWLGLEVQCDGETSYTNLGRQEITATPYALYAQASGGTWSLTGNSGTIAPGNFVGTTDYQPLHFRVNNEVGLRMVPFSGTVSLVAGDSMNFAAAAAAGVVIAGGGDALSNQEAYGHFSTIGGGLNNRVGFPGQLPNLGLGMTVAGGHNNVVLDAGGTIGGGESNRTMGWSATVGGGSNNSAMQTAATVGGGAYNEATGWRSVVAGGFDNEASGEFSAVPGGDWNRAQGDYSFAAGRRAVAEHDGSFVWGDSTDEDTRSQHPDQFKIRANGGVLIDTGGAYLKFQVLTNPNRLIETSTGAFLSTGGAWTNNSDRASKQELASVDQLAVLQSVSELPISTWSYIAEESGVRHMGPMAQDFYAAFGLGSSERQIGTVDADGVALAAIQGLHRLVTEGEARIAELERENAALEQRLASLEAESAERDRQLAAFDARLEALERGKAGNQGAQANLLPGLLVGLLAGGAAFRRVGGKR